MDGLISKMEERISTLEKREIEIHNLSKREKIGLKKKKEENRTELQVPVGL